MTSEAAAIAPSRAFREHTRLPIRLLLRLTAICMATLWAPPAGRTSWFLEVTPGLLMVLWLGLTFRRMPLSHWVCVGVFVHVLILIYGGCYTYALTPLGNWAKVAFHLSRNHYDRVGHVALGVFPVFLTREVLLRKTPLVRGFWLAFLGSQGDIWDAEWDMFMALLGAIAALLVGAGGHDRSMAKVPYPTAC
jgi:putative membrane protein